MSELANSNGHAIVLPGGLGGASHITQSDCKLIERAARWPMTSAIRAKLIAVLVAALDKCESARDYASVGKALIAIEAQNQADEHLVQKDARGGEDNPIQHELKVRFDDRS